MKVHNWPFAAALSVVLMILTSVLIYIYRARGASREING